MERKNFSFGSEVADHFEVKAQVASKYEILFPKSGMSIELNLAAGQSFIIRNIAADVTITLSEIDQFPPGSGLQLVQPSRPADSKDGLSLSSEEKSP